MTSSMACVAAIVIGAAAIAGPLGAADSPAPPAVSPPASSASAAGVRQWPQYRGPNRDGASAEPVHWPAAAPRKLWEITLTKGYGGFSVQDGRIYLSGTPGAKNDFSRATTCCLDAATGAVVWEYTVDKVDRRELIGATPSVADGRVVSIGPGGEMACLTADAGKLLWLVRMELKGGLYCYAASPLIHKDEVIVAAGPAIRAFDLADGRQRWSTEWAIPDGGGRWSSPVLGTVDGRQTVVCLSRSNLVGLDPASGRMLWKLGLEAKPEGEDLINTPVIHDGCILCIAFRNLGARKARLIRVDVKDGRPRLTWKAEDRSGNRCQSPIIWDGCVYLPSDIFPPKTPQERKGQLTCYDQQSGKLLWASRAPQAKGPPGRKDVTNDGGAFMIADGKVLLLDGAGHFTMSAVSAKGCQVLGDFDFETDPNAAPRAMFSYFTPPLLLNGRLYLRDHQKVACYDLR